MAPRKPRWRLWPWLGGIAIAALVLALLLTAKQRGQGEPDWPKVRFVDVTESAGIRFIHTSGATDRKLLPETMGSGVVVIDFDGDGRPDLLFINSRPWPGLESRERERPV